MQKKFNTNGLCYPDKHYMVDLNSRLSQIKNLIDHGDYFVFNRARQYGKTTFLRALKEYLHPDYITISMSFQKMSTAKFRDEEVFAQTFARNFIKKAEDEAHKDQLSQKSLDNLEAMQKDERIAFDLTELFEGLSEICGTAQKPIVLMVDEVDQASNNQVFLDFLGQLREYYMTREETATFHSVILAGVYDIKNLRQKIRPEEMHRYNSPWNIAVPFPIDMRFSPNDILTMLNDYEDEHHTGMNQPQIAEELYFYTGGYPYLVSCLCKILDETLQGWTVQNIHTAVHQLLKENNALFEDVIKNIRNHQDFSRLAEQILLHGATIFYEITNPTINMGTMFGILAEKDGKTVISNVIFETLILNYFTSVRATAALENSDYIEKSQYIHHGRLDMEKVLTRFAAFMKSEYRKEDGDFLEHQGRLLFLSFLRPIINGTGHYVVEPQTRQNKRMDILVFYGTEEFIIELKLWHGQAYEKKGYDQLIQYLDAREIYKGYLISFCRNRKQPQANKAFIYQSHELYEVIIEC